MSQTPISINYSLEEVLKDINRKLDKIDEKFETKLDAIDKKFETKLDAIDKKFETKLDALDKKFETKFDTLDKKFETKFDKIGERLTNVEIGQTKLTEKVEGIDNRLQAVEGTQKNQVWALIVLLAGAIATAGFRTFFMSNP